MNNEDMIIEYKRTLDVETRNKLILSNMGLIRSISNRMIRRMPIGFEFDDLVSYGVIGFIDAIDSYSIKKKCKLSTHAVFKILGAITHAVRAYNFLPERMIDAFSNIQEIKNNNNKYISEEYIIKELGLKSKKDLRTIMERNFNFNFKSLNTRVCEEGNNYLIDFISSHEYSRPEFYLQEKDNIYSLECFLKFLSEMERDVIIMSYYRDLTPEEISIIMEHPRSKICKIRREAIKKIEDNFKDVKNGFNQAKFNNL
jgi:RNA polymerase sigma factor for flagellar operon FliA